MAFDKTPTTWLANWSENGTNITVPIATFSELTAAEADAADGDIRKIAFALVEHLWSQYNAKATADRPVKWTMSKTATVDPVRNVMKPRYVFTFETEIGTQEVADETSSSATATSTPTATGTSTGTSTATSTGTSTATATSTSTSSSSASISTSGTKTGSASASASASATSTSTATSTGTSTATSSGTSTSTSTGTSTATATATH